MKSKEQPRQAAPLGTLTRAHRSSGISRWFCIHDVFVETRLVSRTRDTGDAPAFFRQELRVEIKSMLLALVLLGIVGSCAGLAFLSEVRDF